MSRIARFADTWGGFIEEATFVACAVVCAALAVDILIDFAMWVLA